MGGREKERERERERRREREREREREEREREIVLMKNVLRTYMYDYHVSSSFTLNPDTCMST